ncbi:exodeoxyribonuclease I, partial [Luteimonas sp. 8-5]|nr:exodeoxyribonuclease I [Luteimonas sp. 8-5]
PDTIASRLYLRRDQLAEGEARIPLKEIHLNRCPSLVAWAHLRGADFARLSIDRGLAEARAARLRAAGPALAEKVRRVYAVEREFVPSDADASLYDAFLPDADRRRCAAVRATPPTALAGRDFGFEDPRLPELLFRYRARNWPELLSASERQRWDDWRKLRLQPGSTLSDPNLGDFEAEIAQLRADHAGAPDKLQLLDALESWRRDILP